MKRGYLYFLFIFFVFICNSFASTNSIVSKPITSNSIIGTNSIQSVYSNLLNVPFPAALKSQVPNRSVLVDTFFIIHRSDYGFGLGLSTLRTNLLNAGVAIADIKENKKWTFYSASVSLKVGKSFYIPSTTTLMSIYLESGADFNLNKINTIYNQTIVGLKFSKDFKKETISIGGGIGRNSKWGNDLFYLMHISLSF